MEKRFAGGIATGLTQPAKRIKKYVKTAGTVLKRKIL
jgi:hypothetical protein